MSGASRVARVAVVSCFSLGGWPAIDQAMTLRRLDNFGIVVENLDAAIEELR